MHSLIHQLQCVGYLTKPCYVDWCKGTWVWTCGSTGGTTFGNWEVVDLDNQNGSRVLPWVSTSLLQQLPGPYSSITAPYSQVTKPLTSCLGLAARLGRESWKWWSAFAFAAIRHSTRRCHPCTTLFIDNCTQHFVCSMNDGGGGGNIHLGCTTRTHTAVNPQTQGAEKNALFLKTYAR